MTEQLTGASEKAKRIIFDRIRVELFVAHNALAVYLALADHAHPLNASRFRRTFGLIQHHAFDSFVLSVCKLFEKPSETRPNCSIRTVLELLYPSRNSLIQGVRNFDLLEKYIKKHIDPSFVSTDQKQIEQIPTILIDYFLNECPRTPSRDGKELDAILDAIKVLRDKRVAHYEDADISSLSKTYMDEVLRLLAFADTVVNLVGCGLFRFTTQGEVPADNFQPSKSVVWSEINRMIEMLEL